MNKPDPKGVFARRLAQARRMRGLSLRDLSKATGGRVSHNALHRYEQAEMMPGDEVLISVADALDKPLDFFFRPFAAKLEGVQFRKRTKLGAKPEETIREQAIDFFERYLEIEQILGVPNSFKDPLGDTRLTKTEDAEDAAETVRSKWDLGMDPLPNVIDALEARGMKVFESDAPETFDGFSGWADGHPVIVLAAWLNSDLPRKRLSALHEAAHLLIHPHTDLTGKAQETCCLRFAGAMLMPRKAFESDWGGYRHRISLEELKDLKRRYGISMAAIMHRAHDLDLIDDSVYRRFFILHRSRQWHHAGAEPGEYLGTEVSSRFEQLVLRAVSEEVISLSKGAALMNVAVDELRQRLSDFS